MSDSSTPDLAFLDCFSGVAGDMWVGAWIDLGFPLSALEESLAPLDLDVSLAAETVRRGSLRGTHFHVDVHGPSPHRGLSDILRILEGGKLDDVVVAEATAVFRAIAEVEARVHDTTVDEVHFHEVGADDTIVDVIGVALGRAWFGVQRVYSSAVVTGRGIVHCDHGAMPVPAPGAMGNLIGIPLRSGGPEGECVTPTGAALLKVMVDGFEPDLTWTPVSSGYGAGTRDDPKFPNLLRITLGRAGAEATPAQVVELSCNLDTVTGEHVAYLMDTALARGAVDAYASPVQMKKGRPGYVLTLLATPSLQTALTTFLLEESTSLGVRAQTLEREVLPRWEETVSTEWGPVRFKGYRLPSGARRFRPEDDEVRRICAATGLGRQDVVSRLLLAQSFAREE